MVTTLDGRRLLKTFKRWDDAREWAQKTNDQIRGGLTYNKAKVITGEYLTRWLASAESSLRTSSFQHYTILVNKYLIPAFGDIPLSQLTSDRIQFVYDGWIKNGTGVHTVKKAHAVFHTALERAVLTDQITTNPAEKVIPPKIADKEMAYWTEEEANRFLTTARDNRLYALFYLAVVTGARQMELLGLQWKDIDWPQGKLRFVRQLARKNGKRFVQLKTKASKRTLDLTAYQIGVLREHMGLQYEERRLAGAKWQENDLIFCTLIGTPIQNKNLTDRYYKPLIAAAGVPMIRFHDLRHTAASLMLNHGVSPLVVSKILCHSDPSITPSIYAHATMDMQTHPASVMDEILNIGAVSVQTSDAVAAE